jgi:hypothetical protein
MAAAVLPEPWQLSTHVNSITSQKTDMAVSIVTVVHFKLQTYHVTIQTGGHQTYLLDMENCLAQRSQSFLWCEVVSLDYSCLISIRKTVSSSEELKVHQEKVLSPRALQDEGTSFLRNFGKKSQWHKLTSQLDWSVAPYQDYHRGNHSFSFFSLFNEFTPVILP